MRGEIVMLAVAALALSLAVSSCADPQGAADADADILFPPDGFSIVEGSSISPLARCDGEPRWFLSSLDCGVGYSVSLTPDAGDWLLSCVTPSGKRMSRSLKVTPVVYTPGQDRILVSSQLESSIKLASGTYRPFCVSLDGSGPMAVGIALQVGKSVSSAERELFSAADGVGQPPKRDPPIAALPRSSTPRRPASRAARLSAKAASGAASNRSFIFTNPLDTSSTVSLSAALEFSLDGYEVWLDTRDALDAASGDALRSRLVDLVFPRTAAIWGAPLDVDSDGSIAIVLTSRINETGAILGFFNPLDCLARNDDPSSADYNPGSNEADIVFAALPIAGSAIYSPDSIAATIAHELHHLIHFERKTLGRIWNGEKNVEQEPGFLDEGLSHLEESLCGLGESGGNLAFVKSWLDKPASISLGGVDLDGSSDSSGKRGAMAAFLWFLFQRAGGADWGSGVPKDKGGIAFLRSVMQCRSFGWDALEDCCGASRQQLLSGFAAWINRMRFDSGARPEIIRDAVTGEPVTISPYLGAFLYGTKALRMDGPVIEGYAPTVASLGLCWLQDFGLQDKRSVPLKQAKSGVQIVWGLGM